MSALANAVQPLTLFARREPTTDTVAIAHGMAHRKDVVVYADKDCTQLRGRFPWYYSGLPRRNSRSVMLNCYRWALQWAA